MTFKLEDISVNVAGSVDTSLAESPGNISVLYGTGSGLTALEETIEASTNSRLEEAIKAPSLTVREILSELSVLVTPGTKSDDII